MATTETPCEITRAWLEGDTPKRRSASMRADGNRLLSYGSHFVLAYRLSCGGIAVNEDKYSVTTSRHQSGVALELRSWGFVATDDTFSGPNGHTFRTWRGNA